MLRPLTIAILFLSYLPCFAGGGWPQKRGSGYFKLNQYILVADTYFNPEGNKIDVLPRISYYSSSLYGEYGITDKLTAITFIPFFNRLTLNELVRLDGTVVAGDQLNSFGDTNLSLKYGLGKLANWSFAATITLGLPFGESAGGDSGTLQAGDGEFNQMLTVDAGYSHGSLPIYLNGSLSFNNRTKNLSEEVRYSAEIGSSLGKKALVLLRLQSVNSLRNGNPDPSASQGLFSNNIEYMIVSPEVNWNIGQNKGVSVSMSVPLSGKQVLGNVAWNFGLFWKLSN